MSLGIGDKPVNEGILVQAALAAAAAALSAAGVASPRVDAELLAAHVIGVPRGRLPFVERFSVEQAGTYRRLVEARVKRVPLQHLTGTAPFRRLDIAVGPGVFVPRPETELLVEWGVGALSGPAVVVDLCSGSGAIALSVAHERPEATVYAVEADPGALWWLRRNAEERSRAGDPPVRVVPGDATDPGVLSTLDGAVDLVLCNPPYLPVGTPVEPEVGAHDPAAALFGGPDGLALIPAIVARAAALLRPGGMLGVEHDDSHARAVPDLLRSAGWYDAVADHRDLAGRPRFATARRTGDPRSVGFGTLQG